MVSPFQCARIVALIFLIGAGFLSGPVARAQNISLIASNKPPQATTGFGDVWGDGNLALMGSWTAYTTYGVGIYDISTPSAPNLLKVYNYTNNTGNQFEQGVLRSNILYIGAWGNGNNNGSGVHILSLTNPSSPQLLSRISQDRAGTFTNGFNDVHTVFLERNFLYMAAHESLGILSVKVFDVSDPFAPSYVTTITTTNTAKVHQMTAGKKGDRTILYTSGWGVAPNSMGQTDIWDVTDISTSSPAQWLGRIYSGYSSHSSWPTPDGNTLVVCREIPGGEVSFYDISTPPNPSPSSTTNPAPFCVISPARMGLEADIPHNPVIISNLLFVSWYQNGLQIFDITDQTKPVRIGSFDTYKQAGTSAFQGNWGVYPHLGMNKILVSDINNGFMIFDASAALTATTNYPPLLIKSPVSQTVTQGVTATLEAIATGSSLQYRWFFNGTTIDGATNSSYSIPNVQSNNSGAYSVIISNTLQSITRSVTSSVATLSVIATSGSGPGPTITGQPQNVSVYPEQQASFSVAVSGTGPLTFQWLFNGNYIPNATNNPLVLQNVEGDSVGDYSALVSDNNGSVLSSNASLTLIDSPYINSVLATPGERGAIITWKTGIASDSQVQFDPASASRQQLMAMASASATFSQASYTDPEITTNHSIFLTGLSRGTKYNFQVVSSSGTNSYISGVYSFTTAGGDLILDDTNSAVTFSTNWTASTNVSTYYGIDYRVSSITTNSAPTQTATFTPNIPIPGKYDVYVWYAASSADRATNAPYTIFYDGGWITVYVDQKVNGGQWNLIGSALPFQKGSDGYVQLGNNASGGTVVIADAVRFVYSANQDLPTNGSMPAWWAHYYFHNTSADPNADDDGDGFSNGQEYILGTSPVSANKKVSLKVFRSGGSANVIFWPYLADRNYTLLHSGDLSPNWTPASGGPIVPDSAGEGVLSISVDNPTLDFFRLSVEINAGAAARGVTPYSGSISLTEETALSPYATDPVCGPNRAYVRPRPGF